MCFYVIIMQKKFQETADFVRTWTPAKTVSNEDKLAGYALYKQATIGDCNIPAPGMFAFTVRFLKDFLIIGEG